MSTDKEMMKRSVEVLVETAADAAALAKAQRVSADEQSDMAMEQHATAHKLESLSEDLAQGAAEFKANLARSDKSDARGVVAAGKTKSKPKRRHVGASH